MSEITERASLQRLVVSVAEAAQMIGRDPTFVYRRIYDQSIRVSKKFGRLTVPVSELQTFIGELEFHSPRKDGRGRKPKKQTAEVAAK